MVMKLVDERYGWIMHAQKSPAWKCKVSNYMDCVCCLQEVCVTNALRLVCCVCPPIHMKLLTLETVVFK
jgi:hypothetical protein